VGTDSWHAQFDAGLLFCDKWQVFIKIMVFTYYGCNQLDHQTLKSIFQGTKYYQPGNMYLSIYFTY